jgi:hypothetical protein
MSDGEKPMGITMSVSAFSLSLIPRGVHRTARKTRWIFRPIPFSGQRTLQANRLDMISMITNHDPRLTPPSA